MNKIMNAFRFSENTMKRLDRLAERFHTTKTNICEIAVFRMYVGYYDDDINELKEQENGETKIL